MRTTMDKLLAALLALAMLLGCVGGIAETAAAAAPEGQLTLSDIEAKARRPTAMTAA